MNWAILDCLAPSEREDVLAATTRRRFARGEIIVYAGDAGESLHLLERGRAAVCIGTADGDELTIGVVGPGDYFGEQALVDGVRRRTASVVALEAVETRSLPRGEFDRLRSRNPGIDQVLVTALSERVTRLTLQLAEALFVPVEVRLVRRLVELAVVYGTGDGPPVVPLTQQQIGMLAGTTRPTVNRVLGELAAAGVVEVGRGRVVVCDLAELERRGA